MTITQIGLQISRTSAAKPLYDRMTDDDIRAKQDDRLPDNNNNNNNNRISIAPYGRNFRGANR